MIIEVVSHILAHEIGDVPLDDGDEDGRNDDLVVEAGELVHVAEGLTEGQSAAPLYRCIHPGGGMTQEHPPTCSCVALQLLGRKPPLHPFHPSNLQRL
ncbi:unnamed protein product [Colias eurytheme]|nr:unnamed protein product [Colias eurytheme]